MNYLSKEELLAKLGLAQKPSVGQMVASSLAPFSIGMLMGAGVALLFAPKSGRKLREEIRTRVANNELVNKLKDSESFQRPS